MLLACSQIAPAEIDGDEFCVELPAKAQKSSGTLHLPGGCESHSHSMLLASITRAIMEAEATPTSKGTVILTLREELGLGLAELEIIGTILHRVIDYAEEEFKIILQGAHVVITGDNGWFYDFIRSLDGSYQRISSHASSVPQYGLQLPLLQTVLVGRKCNGDSWFQFEASEWRPHENFCGSMHHIGSWVQYRCTGLNVGPFGLSHHTDRNPLTKRATAQYDTEVVLMRPRTASEMKKRQSWLRLPFVSIGLVISKQPILS